MKLIKIFANAIYSLILFFLILIILGTAFSLMEAPGGIRLFIVQSGSMEPYIKTGSLALTKTQSTYSEGDVVSFIVKSRSNFADYGQTVMHRIVSVSEEDGETVYTTKGDANQGNDPDPVLDSRVQGKVLFSVPYAGYAVSFARTKMGFIFLIAIPAAVIVFLETLTIIKEVQRMLTNRNNKKNINTNTTRSSSSPCHSGEVLSKAEGRLQNPVKTKKDFGQARMTSEDSGQARMTSVAGPAVKAVSLLFFASGILFFTSSSGIALLTDTETATGVSITAGTWGNDPQLTCEFRGEKHMFHFGLDGGYIDNGIFSYILTYTADDIEHVVEGEGLNLNGFYENKIFLGGSSDGVDTPHDNFDRLELDVDLEGSVGHEQRQLQCRFRWRENQWNSEG